VGRRVSALTGSARALSLAGGLGMIETIMVAAAKQPGPGAYHETPTFAQELAQQRYLSRVRRGAEVPGGDEGGSGSPRSSPRRPAK
jgi:hypothetical protein